MKRPIARHWIVLRRSAAAVLLFASLAEPAAAQFTLFDWIKQDDSGENQLSYTAGLMKIFGGAGLTAFKAVAPYDCVVSVSMAYTAWDGVCGVSVPVFLLPGSMTTLAFCSKDAVLRWDVPADSEFGFGLLSGSSFFPGTLFFYNFRVDPAPFVQLWTDLGAGTAGAGGEAPVLRGTSLLAAGYPFELDLTGAAASASVAIVAGLSLLEAPFKGGVLVPAPDVVLTGSSTSATGKLHLDTTWPSAIPASFGLYLQAWIADAEGPAGFAASNALLALTP